MTEQNINHGTPSAYFNGCTCDACKAAGRKYRQEGTMEAFLEGKTRKPPLFMPDDRTQPYDEDDPRHGGLSAYTQGCRCPWCREAGAYYRECRKLGIPMPKGWNARHPETQEPLS